MSMIKTMTTVQLEDLMKRGEEFLLVDVLPRDDYYEDHIEGSRCIPLREAGFVNAVANAVAGKRNKRIVVYCAGETCDASTQAAGELEGAGFTNVFDYKGGLEAWHRSGHGAEETTSGGETRSVVPRSPSDDSARPKAEHPTRGGAQSEEGGLRIVTVAADADAARSSESHRVQLGPQGSRELY
jgi:rhodanese-related sulfurtransferase